MDSLVTERLSDITTAISQDVSLHDAMVTNAGRVESRPVTQQQRTLFRLESTGSSHSDVSPGMALGLAALPFASVCNLTENVSQHSAMGGCLDEAVFDQINQLGLEGLGTIDTQLMGCLESIDPQVLEDLDSDSGLSLETSSGGPVSPGWFKSLQITVDCLIMYYFVAMMCKANKLFAIHTNTIINSSLIQAHPRYHHHHPVHTVRTSMELQATAVRWIQSPRKALWTTQQLGHQLI